MEIRIAHSGSVPTWQSVLARHAAQNGRDYTLCPEPLRFLASSCGDRRWDEIVAAPRPEGGRELLAWVNGRINREPPMLDSSLWGVTDYWATPREFLVLGGDCEDYAIAKFLLLRASGWPSEALRLVIVQDRGQGGFHAVLAARHGGEAFVLDNLLAEPCADDECQLYRPVYSVSESGLYMYRG
jgi:predicted transglutaminase-like cysteine proteinase